MKNKHLRVTFTTGFTKYYPCHNYVIIRGLNLLFIYATETAKAPSETLNYSNVADTKAVMIELTPNPLDEDGIYDNPLN